MLAVQFQQRMEAIARLAQQSRAQAAKTLQPGQAAAGLLPAQAASTPFRIAENKAARIDEAFAKLSAAAEGTTTELVRIGNEGKQFKALPEAGKATVNYFQIAERVAQQIDAQNAKTARVNRALDKLAAAAEGSISSVIRIPEVFSPKGLLAGAPGVAGLLPAAGQTGGRPITGVSAAYENLLNAQVQQINRGSRFAEAVQREALRRTDLGISTADLPLGAVPGQFGVPFAGTPPRGPGGPRGVGRPAAGGGRTAGQMFENLALGAGFPLLFGGGPGQVIGGLLGSFVGPGFGGQILGSALGGQLEQLGVAATEAGKALQKPIDNFGTIEQRALLASSSQERYVKQLIDAGQYIEATAAIQKRYNEVIGTQGSKDLLQLAKSSDLLSRTWGELNLQLQAAVAGPLAAVLQWINEVLKVNITEPGKQAARLQDFMQNLSPEQRKEYFKRSMDLAARNKGVVDPRALQRLQEEMVPGFGAQAAPVVDYQATEAQATASLERRREIQDQITKLRQAELSAAQAQLQQDVSILTKQQEFSLSLNQQYAIIDKIAAKKTESANLEYQQVQRTQQTEIINKQLALEAAKAKAIAAKEEIKQLDAAGKLTPLKQIELQAVIDKVFVAEKDLAITKEVANVATQRAGADAQSAKYLTDIEARQQKVAAYAADAARQTEAFNRSANEAVNALNNNLSVIQAYSQAQQTINNLQIQSLQSNLQLATSTSERLAILNKIRDLEILNAKIALNATRAQIKAEVERQRIALAMTEQKYKQLQADVAMAKAQGVLNQDHLEALANQKSALTIAVDNYNTSLKVANEQWRAADAVYEAAVRAADFKLSMEAAARSAQQTAAAATTTAEQTAAAANYTMGATATVRTKALPLTQKQLLEMKNRLGGTAGLSASYYGQNAETLAATKARSQQQQEAMAQQMADNLQRLRSTAAERSSGTAGPINIQTGPVLQQDGKKYVTLEDMESAIQSMASTMYSSNRAAGTQRFTGVR